MDFRKRLFIAFLVMTIFPILLICGIGLGLFRYQTSAFQDNFNTEIDALQVLQNPMQLLNRITRGAFNEIRTLSESNPDRLLDKDFLNTSNEALRERQAFLVVLKDNDVFFCGDTESYSIISEFLPEHDCYSTTVDGGLYISARISCLVKQVSFIFTDGSEGTVYIVSNATNLLPQTKRFLIQIIFASITVFLITGLLLIIWLYAGIVRPIFKLKGATERMKEGDLDFYLEQTGDDEIGELSKDFEEMRAHMKSEIDARIDYDQELRDLVGNISHDLKTPLTTIKGYAEGIIDGVAATPEKQMRYLKMIRAKAEDMTKLVEELALYTQIDCRNYPYHFERVRIIEFFLDYMEEETIDLERKGIRLDFMNQLSKNTEVRADVEQLRRVVMNIVGNSAKYMGGKNGTILVHLSEDSQNVCIEISDTGIGISEEALPHIFERFFRSDASRNSGKGGSGIGLCIVKRIVEDHGGRIQAKSKVNEGTSISFTLPKYTQNENKNLITSEHNNPKQ